MELKVVCGCGQKYKFDVEPVNGRMPFAVNCPACNADGTMIANSLISQMPPAPAAVPIPVMAEAAAAAPAPGGLKINRPMAPPPVAPPMAMHAVSSTAAARPSPSAGKAAMPKYMQTNKDTQYNNFLLGIVGACVGAVVAVGLMVGFTMFTHFRFPLLGTVMGAIIGFGARFMYRGTDTTLGAMAAVVAFFAIGGTLYFLFGIIGMLLCMVSLIIGVGMAFKIAS
jgi:hypothetical protein